ncbi:MAG: hypothetical protein HQK87_11935, partial [Nitrospinae bacterium]|nr:hypothetical protein [Nitrospinota bacterium]
DFRPDTPGWQRWRLSFHNWATLATARSKRTLMFLYPALPFAGEYPFRDLHERVMAAARDTSLTLHTGWFPRERGRLAEDGDLDHPPVNDAIEGMDREGYMVFGPYLALPKGEGVATFRMRAKGVAPETPVARIDVAYDKGKTIVAQRVVTAGELGADFAWSDISLPYAVTADRVDDGEFRVYYMGKGIVEVSTVTFPVVYRVEAYDLTPRIKGTSAWISRFDAHPNEAANRVMADALYDYLTTGDDPSIKKPDAYLNP